MKYEEYLPEIVDQEKYSDYCRFIIDNSKSKGDVPNLEGHHVVPKCFLPKEFASDKENIVYLTCAEHLIAHKFLYEFTKNKKMLYAIYQMTNTYKLKVDKQFLESAMFEQIRIEAREMSSKHQKGKVFTEQHRKNLSESRKGYVMSKEQREKISAANTGKIKDEVWRKNLSKSHVGIINRKYGTKMIHKEDIELQVWEDEIEKYLSEGWQLGRKQIKYTPPSVRRYIWINKEGKNTRVSPEELARYIDNGWQMGRHKKPEKEKLKEKEIYEKKKNAVRYSSNNNYHKDFV